MFTKVQKQLILKLFSMFVVVRGFNLAMIVVAQYITAIFIMAPNQSLSEVLLDRTLFALILASVAAIASGYIINNFYDSEKDGINRPQQVSVEKMVSQNTKLILYFCLLYTSPSPRDRG